MTPVDATCWTLIHAAAAGDRMARDGFARLYEPIARTYFAARWRQSRCLAVLDDAAVVSRAGPYCAPITTFMPEVPFLTKGPGLPG